MNDITFQLCGLWGDPLDGGLITDHLAGSLSIERTLNDVCTAEVAVDIYDPVGELCQKPNNGLTRIVKAFYAPTKTSHPIFTGVLLEPDWKFADSSLTLAAVDAPFRLQRAFLATPLTVTARDIGQAMVDAIGRAANRPYPLGHAGLGISIGTIEATYAIDREWDAGECVWDILEELSQLAGAPDMNFVPLDLTDGTLWRFDAYAPLSTDRSATAVFEAGTGLDNCRDMEYSPSGDPVENYYSAMGQPPDDGSLTNPIGHARHDASIVSRGIYEGWDSNDATDLDVEKAKAQEMVSAYFEPPDYITIYPNQEGTDYPSAGVPPRYDIDWFLGDVVRAVARKGTMMVDELARAQTVTIADGTEAGDMQITLEVAPNVDPSGVTVF